MKTRPIRRPTTGAKAVIAEKSNLLLRAVRYLANKAAEKGVEEIAKKVLEASPLQKALGALAVMIVNSIDKTVEWLANVIFPF